MRLFLMLAGLLASASLYAQTDLQARLKTVQADPVALKTAIAAGKTASFFCANCHGEAGVSKTPDVPNLAGQNPAYILEQIRKFGSGERKNDFMQGLIKVLDDQDRLNITLYFTSLGVPPSKSPPALAAQGGKLFRHLCVRCHGEEARGNETIPRLAGQKVLYLQSSITRYRDRTGVRNSQAMSIATSILKDDEVLAIANYLTQLP